MKVIYYAHCTALYGTPQEARDVELIGAVFSGTFQDCRVVNPGADHQIKKQCDAIEAEVKKHNRKATLKRDASQEKMDRVFKIAAQTCHVLVFRALPDGMIPAGVAKEIAWAEEAGIPVMELPSSTLRRVLTLPQTRQYLKEIGQR